MKHDVFLYFKVLGLIQDETGDPDYVGIKFPIGSTDNDIPYSEIIKKTTDEAKKSILDYVSKLFSSKTIKLEDMVIITPQEYEQDYENE